MFFDAATRRRVSLGFLLLTNLAVVAAVLFGKIDVYEVVVLYWAESAVIGVFAVLKLLCAPGRRPRAAAPEGKEGPEAQEGAEAPRVTGSSIFARVFMAGFFCVHFGGFMAVHLLFLISFVSSGNGTFAVPEASLRNAGFMIIGLFVSHGVSFVMHYWVGGERERVDAGTWFFRPYVRIFVMQATLIFGGIVVMALQSPIGLVALLVVLKTVVDAFAHTREHEKFAAVTPRADIEDQRTGVPPVA